MVEGLAATGGHGLRAASLLCNAPCATSRDTESLYFARMMINIPQRKAAGHGTLFRGARWNSPASCLLPWLSAPSTAGMMGSVACGRRRIQEPYFSRILPQKSYLKKARRCRAALFEVEPTALRREAVPMCRSQHTTPEHASR